jgi:enterochelin esterase-like enzyme
VVAPPVPQLAPRLIPGAPATVTFALADDNSARLSGVRLWQEVRIPGDQLDFDWSDGAWTLTVPRPAVDRMEYLFELTHTDGRRETICDPANPRRVGGAFGDHSVHEFPEYRAPRWLDVDVDDPGTFDGIDIAAEGIAQGITGQLWTAPGLAPDTAAALIVVHDGPEYDQLASFTRYLGAQIALGAIAPLRAALLAPGPRDEWYSASGAYGRALTRVVLPQLRAVSPVSHIIGMGASLGALEMLVAHRDAPRAFDGLFLQSGSYFQRGLDDQERRFSEFERIARSVEGVLASAGSRRTVPTALTCGGIEENLGNNRAMLRALVAQGYPAELTEVRDVHNYTAWRDAFDPQLTALLQKVIGGGSG